MGIMSVGYGVTSTGLDVAANVPGGLGRGFLFVGNFLVGVSVTMRSKAAEYRSIAHGLDLLDAQTVATADVEAYMEEKGCSFNEALVAVASRVEAGNASGGDKKKYAEETVVETVEEGEGEAAAVVVVEDTAGAAQKVIVEDEDGDIRPKDTSAVMNVAAGLA